jgi:adenylosuccinate lyase
MDSIEAVSPIDGRYHRKTQVLSDFFSERALISYRIRVEGEYLIALSENPNTNVRNLTRREMRLIRNLYNPNVEEAKEIKKIETKGNFGIPATNHDVKAVEYGIKHRLKHSTLEDSLEYIHFGLTSMDIDNMAYGLMLSDSLDKVILPAMDAIYYDIDENAKRYASIPLLARTHGQPASPTTFGKEYRVFAERLGEQIAELKNQRIKVKFNGASGNYNAHNAAYPNIDWPAFSIRFVNRFNRNRKIKLTPNLYTTQIEPHDTYAEIFHNVMRINNILIDFSQDMWRYISDGWIKQKPVAGEIGSSAMPHKVNPIDFENAEGNLGLANAIGEFFARKLPISRLQRDLSDSTVQRNFGVMFGHSLIAYSSITKAMSKCAVDEQRVVQELNAHPEVIAEAIQTILRRERAEMPYEQLKELTRGKAVTMEDFGRFIDGLDVDEQIREELHAITPENYTGIAEVLALKY